MAFELKIRLLDCEFLFTCGSFFTLIFTVFSIFLLGGFLTVIPNAITAKSGSGFFLFSQ